MSEATFVTILAARKEAVRKFKMTFPSLEESEINSRLVAYCSDQVCAKKSSIISSIAFQDKYQSGQQISYIFTFLCNIFRRTHQWKKPH
jgi:hypothetical protein